MIRSLYLTNRFFLALGGLILLFVLGFSFPWIFGVAKVASIVFALLVIADLLLLYNVKKGISAV